MPTTSKNTVRRTIEEFLSGYAKMYPIDNFQKAFAFSRLLLKNNFGEICNDTFIPMLEDHVGLNRTRWDKSRDKLTDSYIHRFFPYTWYALYHHLAFPCLSG